MGLTTENVELKTLLEIKQQQAELRDGKFLANFEYLSTIRNVLIDLFFCRRWWLCEYVCRKVPISLSMNDKPLSYSVFLPDVNIRISNAGIALIKKLKK